MHFSARLDRFGSEVFAALKELRMKREAQGLAVIDLSIGTPDFEPPAHLVEAYAQAARDPECWKYAIVDTPEMLQAVCSYYERRFGVQVSPDMVCSAHGTQEGMGMLALALVDEGDTVLVPDPCYPVFQNAVLLSGATPWYYPLSRETGFVPRVSDIPAEVADAARYMVVSLPANPVGSIGTPELYRELIAFAREHDLLIVHDNAYSDIIYDGAQGGSFLAYEGAAEVGVEFFSLSKSFNVTGLRISYLVGRPDVIAAFKRLHSQIDFGMPLPQQRVAVAALTGPLDSVRTQCALYQERRDALCDGLVAAGWERPNAQGTMFVWAKLPHGREDSLGFAMELMERTGVIVTPGASFGPHGEGYVRFALVQPPERLREVCELIAASGL